MGDYVPSLSVHPPAPMPNTRLALVHLQENGYNWAHNPCPDQYFCNLDIYSMKANKRMIYSREVCTKIRAFCARNRVSAHALPSGTQTLELMKYISFDTADAGAYLFACQKVLYWIQRNVNSQALPDILRETPDVPAVRVSAFRTSWKIFARHGNVDWSLESGMPDQMISSEWSEWVHHPFTSMKACLHKAICVKSASIKAAREIQHPPSTHQAPAQHFHRAPVDFIHPPVQADRQVPSQHTPPRELAQTNQEPSHPAQTHTPPSTQHTPPRELAQSTPSHPVRTPADAQAQTQTPPSTQHLSPFPSRDSSFIRDMKSELKAEILEELSRLPSRSGCGDGANVGATRVMKEESFPSPAAAEPREKTADEQAIEDMIERGMLSRREDGVLRINSARWAGEP